MRSAGASPELIASTLHAMRRTIGTKYKDLTRRSVNGSTSGTFRSTETHSALQSTT